MNSTPQPLEMADHVQHASQHAMAQETSLLGNSSYAYAQGERPLWEFPSDKQETPLGDVARAYRKEHAATAKAVKTLDK
jgi:hypothetical protein